MQNDKKYTVGDELVINQIDKEIKGFPNLSKGLKWKFKCPGKWMAFPHLFAEDVYEVVEDKQVKKFQDKKHECEDAIKQENFDLAEQLISDLKNLAIEDDSEEEKIKDMESRLSQLKITFKQEQPENDESMSNENEQEEDDFSKAIPISVLFQIEKLHNICCGGDTTLQEQQYYETEQEINYSKNKFH